MTEPAQVSWGKYTFKQVPKAGYTFNGALSFYLKFGAAIPEFLQVAAAKARVGKRASGSVPNSRQDLVYQHQEPTYIPRLCSRLQVQCP